MAVRPNRPSLKNGVFFKDLIFLRRLAAAPDKLSKSAQTGYKILKVYGGNGKECNEGAVGPLAPSAARPPTCAGHLPPKGGELIFRLKPVS